MANTLAHAHEGDWLNRKAATTQRRKPRGDGHERRPEILNAARKIFAEEGYEQATMRRVAEVAEVSTAGIYIYFQSKEAILAAIRDETFVELHAFASKAIECASGPQDRLVRHLRAYLDYARDHPDTYRLTFRSQLIRAPRPGRPSSPAEASGREAFTALVADIAAAVDPQQHLDADKAHAMAEAAWAAVHGMASLVIDVPGFPASGFDSAFGELVHMVISGIRNRTG